MTASRGRRDEADIQFLLDRCNITTVDEARAVYEEQFPEDELSARAHPMLRYALEQLSSGSQDEAGPRST